jgi:hypothetical protein
MRFLTFLFYLAAVTFAFLVANILLYSIQDKNNPKLRQSTIDHTVIPCGEREIHDELVQYITEHEPRYLHCLQLEREIRDFVSSECHFGSGHTEMLRRFHKLRNEQEQEIRIIQIGAMDGKSNDPIFQAIYKPHLSPVAGKYWPPYSLKRVRAVLVEPVHMTTLLKQYATWTHDIPDMEISHFQFVEKAISQAEDISAAGKCVFFTPSPQCPLKIQWARQISGLDPAYMKKVFGNHSDTCIQEHSLPCVTISGLLQSTGQDLVLRRAAVGGVQEERWCHRTTSHMPQVGWHAILYIMQSMPCVTV